MIVRRLCKLGQQVYASRVCFAFRETKGFDLLDRGEALCRPRLSKERHGEDGMGKADALSEQTDGVLLEEEVKDGHLANLYKYFLSMGKKGWNEVIGELTGPA